MIALNAEVKQPESVSRYSREGRTYGIEHVLAPQRRQIRMGTERHVDGAARIVQRASPVRHTRAPELALTSGTISPAAPCRWRSQFQLSSSTPHLESGTYYSKLASMSSPIRCMQAMTTPSASPAPETSSMRLLPTRRIARPQTRWAMRTTTVAKHAGPRHRAAKRASVVNR